MTIITIGCARCAQTNHPSERFCECCGLPLGSAEPDSEANLEALGPYEAPDASDGSTDSLLRDFVQRAGAPVASSGRGYRLVVPVRPDRKQAVYIGVASHDPDDRPIVAIVSVCGPANARDARTLMMLNGRLVEGHFAIRVMRGEEYFVVIHNVPASTLANVDAERVIRRIAEAADRLEDRLSHGRDLY